MTFPKEGDWDWSIQAFTMSQKMPVLSVAVLLKGQPVSNNEPVVNALPISLLLIVRLSTLGIGVIGLIFAYRRRSRLAVGLVALCLVVGINSFVAVPNVPGVEAQSKSSSDVAVESTLSQAEMGRQLFIAKGCIACHANAKATKDSSMTLINDAPNLSSFSASPETLRMRLENPRSLKYDTWMPDLDLSDAEIETLIVFINSN
ncbi:MAG TPA: cytochrome c [Anaerolineales bacterium]|nr:cytochrome c [Anaerolineales bacterium]